jgi:hypothetical protein
VAGLGYKCKESGSPFKNTGSMATISCYKYGLHKPRSMGIFKKLINQQMFMCGDCMPAKSAQGSDSFTPVPALGSSLSWSAYSL